MALLRSVSTCTVESKLSGIVCLLCLEDLEHQNEVTLMSVLVIIDILIKFLTIHPKKEIGDGPNIVV